LLELHSHTLWFFPAVQTASTAPARRTVEKADVTQALAGLGGQVHYNQLRQQIMMLTAFSKRTAQLAITKACQLAAARLDCSGQRPLRPPLSFTGVNL